MNNRIEQHPTILHTQDLAQICRPLQTLNITYFCHVNIHNETFAAVANNPEFHRHYLKNEYYNADIHMADRSFIKDYFVWDAIEFHGDTQRMKQEAITFGVNHAFTIYEKNQSGDNYYHFATNMDNQSINQFYLTNIDLLKMFILHFNHAVNSSALLANAYDIRFGINDSMSGYQISDQPKPEPNTKLREDFLPLLNIGNTFSLPNGTQLSSRECQILYWLHMGKTIDDISRLLGMASITIHKQISSLKTKLNCYTQFQLGEFYGKTAPQIPLLQSIVKVM